MSSTPPKLKTSSAGIDESSISPTRSSAKIDLEKKLSLRSDGKDLRDRNILPAINIAPSLQAVQHDLDWRLKSDGLKKNLGNRPNPQELVDKNILHSTNVAPALQDKQKKLDYHMKSDALENLLAKRPTVDSLVDNGILKEAPEEIK